MGFGGVVIAFFWRRDFVLARIGLRFCRVGVVFLRSGGGDWRGVGWFCGGGGVFGCSSVGKVLWEWKNVCIFARKMSRLMLKASVLCLENETFATGDEVVLKGMRGVCSVRFEW